MSKTLICKTKPVACWVTGTYKNEFRLLAQPLENGIINYSITNRKGLPVGDDYIHRDLYRERPLIADDGWQEKLKAILESYKNVEILEFSTPS